MLKGLNREAGVRPALSRNCNGEQSRICPLGKPEKAWPSDDPKPGELPVLTSVKTCDAQGGYMCTVYLMKTVLSLFCCVLQLGGCVSWCVVMMYFDRKLTHWQFPVLFLDTKRKSLEGGRAVLAAAAQYGYEIKENYQRD